MSVAEDPLLHLCPTLVFVAHGGALEAKAALLAASLADFYLPARAGRVVCRVVEPASHWGDVTQGFRTLLDRLGIEIRPVRNAIDPGYAHGNKIDALGGITGPAVFLDSDMLLMVPLSWHFALMNADMAAKPADLDTFGRSGGKLGAGVGAVRSAAAGTYGALDRIRRGDAPLLQRRRDRSA